MSRKDRGLLAVFGAPLALAVLGLVGLVGALLNDGPWDAIGSALLATSLIVAAWARLRSAKR